MDEQREIAGIKFGEYAKLEEDRKKGADIRELSKIPNSPSKTKENLNHQRERKRGLASFNRKKRGTRK